MSNDIVTDTGPEAQAGVPVDQFCELSIHVGFNQLPIITYPDDSEPEQSVKYGPPFLRFPVNLSAKDAAILENIFRSSAIALVGFEVKNGDGSPRTYQAVVAR